MSQILAVLVTESRLDRAAFLGSSVQITGKHHARSVDKETYRSVQAGDIEIVNDFCGQHIGSHVFYLGFLIGGLTFPVNAMIERTSAFGMPHVNAELDNPLAKAALITGSVRQWGFLVQSCCARSVPQPVREAATQIYHIMCQKGLQSVFDGYKRQTHADGTVLLLASA